MIIDGMHLSFCPVKPLHHQADSSLSGISPFKPTQWFLKSKHFCLCFHSLEIAGVFVSVFGIFVRELPKHITLEKFVVVLYLRNRKCDAAPTPPK